MKEPNYEDAKRCLEIRKHSKSGGRFIPEDMKFCEMMNKKYPEWYKNTEREVFYTTRPFGSETKFHGDK